MDPSWGLCAEGEVFSIKSAKLRPKQMRSDEQTENAEFAQKFFRTAFFFPVEANLVQNQLFSLLAKTISGNIPFCKENASN